MKSFPLWTVCTNYLSLPFVNELFTFFGLWPVNMRRKCGLIGFDKQNLVDRFNTGLANYWKDHNERQHHALVDARSLLFAWEYAIKKSGRKK
jgi:hypothetical protein